MTNGTVYSIPEIAAIVKGRVTGNTDPGSMVSHLLIDSRRLLTPAGTLFFALKTQKNDGHRYIGELLEQGVRCFVVQKIHAAYVHTYPDAVFIEVSDSLRALQDLASAHRSRFSYPVVAITGSNGKTIVKEWLCQMLYERFHIVRNPKSYNSQIGVPLSVWLMTGHHQMALFEAGISRPGEMDSLEGILRPGTGIFTNIGPAHDEGFGSRKQKIQEKLKLFVRCDTLIYCRDHQLVHDEIQVWRMEHPGVSLYTWGRHDLSDMRIAGTDKGQGKTTVSVQTGAGNMLFTIPFADDASAENAMHAAAYMQHIGCDQPFIVRQMAALQPVAMRLEMKEGMNNSVIVNDSYNSDLHSLAIALDFLVSQTPEKRKTVVLSDILQSGIPDNALYGEVARMLASRNVDRLIGIGPGISSQAGVFTIPATFYHDTSEFIHRADLHGFRNDAVLLKGARIFGFEHISNLLQQKDHQTILEIDLDALIHNLNVYRSHTGTGVKLMGVVKAFSYGSGSVEVARVLQYHHVDYLGVAYADEGKALREGGIRLPVVVMNPEVRTFNTLFDYGLEPEVFGLPLLHRIASALQEYPAGKRSDGYPVHIKLDTGMHRLGFMEHQLDALLEMLAEHPRIRVASVFSHLAASEDPAHDVFTRKQVSLFSSMCRKLEKALDYPFLRHICNSAAVSRFPDAHFDMVRLGIGLYGISGDSTVQPYLRHVGRFRSVVSQCKSVSAGESVGYNRAFTAKRDMELAVVPIGYADGLSRSLGNGRGHLMVHGKKVPVVGNISMDMCTIDVSGMQVREGDEVIVFGPEMPAGEMARAMGTIPYEVLTSVSQRVKRIYLQE